MNPWFASQRRQRRSPDPSYAPHGAASASQAAPHGPVAPVSAPDAPLEAARLDPPIEPCLIQGADTFGRAVWARLYDHLPAARQPPMVAVLVEPTESGYTLRLVETALAAASQAPTAGAAKGHAGPGDHSPAATASESAARAAMLSDATFEQRVMTPLLRAVTQIYRAPLALTITNRGAVFVSDCDEGYARMVAGREPYDPRIPHARMSRMLYAIWESTGGFLNRPHPLVIGVGAASAILLWIALAVFVQVWLTAIIPRLVSAMRQWPVTSEWSPTLLYGVAFSVNALEIIGLFLVLDRITNTIGWLMALIEIPFHLWYGAQRAMDVQRETIWTASGMDWGMIVFSALVGAFTAILPEGLMAGLLVAAIRLTPLIPAAVIELRMVFASIATVAQGTIQRQRAELARQEGRATPQTIIREDGTIETVYIRSTE